MNLLEGVRVVEIADEIAGPYCGKLFADVGAEVIKVESPRGDRLRRRGTGRQGTTTVLCSHFSTPESVPSSGFTAISHVDGLIARADISSMRAPA